ncbi:tetratricopeptide repeat protein [Pelomonas sp. BJYL3]|uniref:tetratricopeptide repeat protein n=1 Tax=Pelomonas sp. BJYL3 TaxID=2976697 RepID=UPI0022B590A4|nr:tetratricopeptide repeat protein [Pelomonas sp. BJYL3]
MKPSAQFLEAMAAYDADNESLALRLMERCAEAGDPVACYMTALWYKNGEGAPPDSMLCTYWLQRLEQLAEDGNLVAQYELSGMHRWGDLLPLNVELANRWLERAAEGGYGEAQHHLAWYYEFGEYDYPADKVAAESWYQRAFEQGHPETLYLVAIRQFKDGKPTEPALELLRKAADKGFKQAEHVLRSLTH